MKKSLKMLTALSVASLLALASASADGSKVADALNGKLVRIENGKPVAASIDGDPEYFLFYHSASW